MRVNCAAAGGIWRLTRSMWPGMWLTRGCVTIHACHRHQHPPPGSTTPLYNVDRWSGHDKQDAHFLDWTAKATVRARESNILWIIERARELASLICSPHRWGKWWPCVCETSTHRCLNVVPASRWHNIETAMGKRPALSAEGIVVIPSLAPPHCPQPHTHTHSVTACPVQEPFVSAGWNINTSRQYRLLCRTSLVYLVRFGRVIPPGVTSWANAVSIRGRGISDVQPSTGQRGVFVCDVVDQLKCVAWRSGVCGVCGVCGGDDKGHALCEHHTSLSHHHLLY